MKNKLPPYDYNNLRTTIHIIFYDLLDREFECAKGNEFDNEFLEMQTDEVLRLIRQQGGEV